MKNTMKFKIIKYRRWLLDMSYFKRFGVSFLIMVGIGLVEVSVAWLIGEIANVDWDAISLYDSLPKELQKLIPLLLLLAFTESFLNQYLPFKIFKFFYDNCYQMVKIIPYIIVSGIVFGALHWSPDLIYPCLNITRVIFHSIGGMHLAMTFYVFRKKRQCGLFTITLMHWLYNIVGFVIPG